MGRDTQGGPAAVGASGPGLGSPGRARLRIGLISATDRYRDVDAGRRAMTESIRYADPEGSTMWRATRWVLAAVLWLIAIASVLIAGLLFAMEGEFFVGCSDAVCEGGIPAAIAAVAVAMASTVLGWLVRPRSRRSHQVERRLWLSALAIFWVGVALVAAARERWFEGTALGEALLPAGLAVVGAGILMAALSVRRRPAAPRPGT